MRRGPEPPLILRPRVPNRGSRARFGTDRRGSEFFRRFLGCGKLLFRPSLRRRLRFGRGRTFPRFLRRGFDGGRFFRGVCGGGGFLRLSLGLRLSLLVLLAEAARLAISVLADLV